ncbi:MAG: hypothetical protein IPL95_12965 [Saprospiraceae bacterium]|nr:hypothetical protein [Saprospiraceae bacterium]
MKKLIYFVFLLFTSNSLISQTLEITTQADKTDILTGESILYTLKYKCASTTTNCTKVSIEANIPSGIKFNGAVIGLTSDIASYSYSNNNKTVTFIFKEPLIAGNTGIIEITGIGDLGLQNGTVATMTASIFSDGNLASSDFENTTLHSYDGFVRNYIHLLV